MNRPFDIPAQTGIHARYASRDTNLLPGIAGLGSVRGNSGLLLGSGIGDEIFLKDAAFCGKDILEKIRRLLNGSIRRISSLFEWAYQK